jgi:hypothetical protein
MKYLPLLLLLASCNDNTAPADMSMPDSSMADLLPPPDLAMPDFSGVTCGNMSCTVGHDCCIILGGGGAIQPMCVPTGTCADGGVVAMCDGPEDCSTGTPNCCVTVDIGGGGPDGGLGNFQGGDAMCTQKCPGSFILGGTGGTVHTRLCHQTGDCTGYTGQTPFGNLKFDSCCSRDQGPSFCAPGLGATMGLYTCQ